MKSTVAILALMGIATARTGLPARGVIRRQDGTDFFPPGVCDGNPDPFCCDPNLDDNCCEVGDTDCCDPQFDSACILPSASPASTATSTTTLTVTNTGSAVVTVTSTVTSTSSMDMNTNGPVLGSTSSMATSSNPYQQPTANPYYGPATGGNGYYPSAGGYTPAPVYPAHPTSTPCPEEYKTNYNQYPPKYPGEYPPSYPSQYPPKYPDSYPPKYPDSYPAKPTGPSYPPKHPDYSAVPPVSSPCPDVYTPKTPYPATTMSVTYPKYNATGTSMYPAHYTGAAAGVVKASGALLAGAIAVLALL